MASIIAAARKGVRPSLLHGLREAGAWMAGRRDGSVEVGAMEG